MMCEHICSVSMSLSLTHTHMISLEDSAIHAWSKITLYAFVLAARVYA